MIDIHSHIIYGVDDGSKSVETSLEMLRLAVGAGTTDIVATPHANGDYQFRPDINAAHIAELQTAVPEIRVHTGCDFHLSYENVEDAFRDPRKYTINHLNHLLVEFPDGALIPNIDDIFDRFLSMGVIPIITHPERNWMIQQSWDVFARWVQMGCLVQVTGGSLTGRFGKPAQQFANRVLDSGLCHFIASDAHDTVDRHPRLTNAREFVRKGWGEENADLLLSINGRAAIEGGRTRAMAGKKRKRWFLF